MADGATPFRDSGRSSRPGYVLARLGKMSCDVVEPARETGLSLGGNVNELERMGRFSSRLAVDPALEIGRGSSYTGEGFLERCPLTTEP